MTPAEKLFNVLANARTQNGGVLSKDQWLAAAGRFLSDFKPPRKKNVLGKGLTDEEWHAELAKDPDYAGINIPDEARKCRLYFKGNLIPSRPRILKWLAKATPTMPINGTGARTPASNLDPIAVPPDDWSGLIRDDEDDGQFAGRAWESLMPFYQHRIARKVAAIKRTERKIG